MAYLPSSPVARTPSNVNDKVITLLENVQYDSDGGSPKRLGFYGAPPEPESLGRSYPPPSIPQGTQHIERYQYTHQLRFLDREDELAPAATGILTVIGGEGGLMMMKIIRNVPISWHWGVITIPLRIQWEIEALEKTGRLGSEMLHQWGYWADPATVQGCGSIGGDGSGSAMGEVYVSITKESGAPLREYMPYAELGSEDERAAFLKKLKGLVAKRIAEYAIEDGVFHGDLNLGNIHIIPEQRIHRYHDKPPVFEPTGDFEVQFTDWGWVRKVTGRIDVVDGRDPWLVPKTMIIPKGKGRPGWSDEGVEVTDFVRQYIDAVFETVWKLKGWNRGGVDDWRHPW